jgi:hypothetical protein
LKVNRRGTPHVEVFSGAVKKVGGNKNMDNAVLKKRLNTFKSAKGYLTKVSDEVVIEVLRAWEHWPGSSSELYRELGLNKMQLVTMIQKAKRLIKSGVVTESEFREVKLPGAASSSGFAGGPCVGIELSWDQGKIIRFPEVTQLVDFLKKVA